MKKRAERATVLVHSVNAMYLFLSFILEGCMIFLFLFGMQEFEISFSEPSVGCYVAFLLQFVSYCAFVGLYWSAGWYQRLSVSAGGIQQVRFCKTVKEIRWQDVQEVGIKWRLMGCDQNSAWIWGGKRGYCGFYYVYFSDHILSMEERIMLGSWCRKKASPPGVIYYASMEYRTEYRILECKRFPNPPLANNIAAYFPAFSALCAAFEIDDETGKCIDTTPDGAFHKTNLMQDPIGVRQFKREKCLVRFTMIAYLVVFLVVIGFLAHQGSRG